MTRAHAGSTYTFGVLYNAGAVAWVKRNPAQSDIARRYPIAAYPYNKLKLAQSKLYLIVEPRPCCLLAALICRLNVADVDSEASLTPGAVQ